MKFNRKPPPGNVRRVRSTGRNIIGGLINKAGREVQFESWQERALLLRLDRDPDVRDYSSQPETFEYVDMQGKTRHYTPDFIVWRYTGRIEVHEVTLAKRQMSPEMQRREAVGSMICQARGWCYLVHTEEDLPQGAELANLLALIRYRPTAHAHQAVAKAVSQQLEQDQPVILGQLIKQVAQELSLPEPRVMAALGHLLWHGQLKTDLTHLIFGSTRTGLIFNVPVWQEVSHDAPSR